MSVSEAEVLRLLTGEEFQGLEELIRFPPDEVVPVLIERSGRDLDPLVRQRSVVALGMIGDPRAVPALQSRLDDPSAPVAMSAIEALGRLGHDASAEQIARLLSSSDASVRQTAAQVLGVLGVPGSQPALRRLLESEKEPFVRDAAVESLRRIEAGVNPSR